MRKLIVFMTLILVLTGLSAKDLGSSSFDMYFTKIREPNYYIYTDDVNTSEESIVFNRSETDPDLYEAHFGVYIDSPDTVEALLRFNSYYQIADINGSMLTSDPNFVNATGDSGGRYNVVNYSVSVDGEERISIADSEVAVPVAADRLRVVLAGSAGGGETQDLVAKTYDVDLSLRLTNDVTAGTYRGYVILSLYTAE